MPPFDPLFDLELLESEIVLLWSARFVQLPVSSRTICTPPPLLIFRVAPRGLDGGGWYGVYPWGFEWLGLEVGGIRGRGGGDGRVSLVPFEVTESTGYTASPTDVKVSVALDWLMVCSVWRIGETLPDGG